MIKNFSEFVSKTISLLIFKMGIKDEDIIGELVFKMAVELPTAFELGLLEDNPSVRAEAKELIDKLESPKNVGVRLDIDGGNMQIYDKRPQEQKNEPTEEDDNPDWINQVNDELEASITGALIVNHMQEWRKKYQGKFKDSETFWEAYEEELQDFISNNE